MASGVAASMTGSDGKAPWAARAGGGSGGGVRSPAGNHTSSDHGEKASDIESILHQTRWNKFTVVQTEEVGQGTICLTVQPTIPILEGKEVDILEILGGGRAGHVNIAAQIGHELVSRPYTPFVRTSTSPSEFQLAVKKYETGIMSKHLCGLQVGDLLQMTGPIGGLNVAEHARLVTSGAALLMIAGGTGITPMLQLMYGMLRKKREGDRRASSSSFFSSHKKVKLPCVRLVFVNRSSEAIILKDDLDALKSDWVNAAGDCKVDYAFTSRPNPGGNGGAEESKISQEERTSVLISEHVPAASRKRTIALVCGPPAFNTSVSSALINKCGYVQRDIVAFA
jgi:cytochrome-b5 reductase